MQELLRKLPIRLQSLGSILTHPQMEPDVSVAVAWKCTRDEWNIWSRHLCLLDKWSKYVGLDVLYKSLFNIEESNSQNVKIIEDDSIFDEAENLASYLLNKYCIGLNYSVLLLTGETINKERIVVSKLNHLIVDANQAKLLFASLGELLCNGKFIAIGDYEMPDIQHEQEMLHGDIATRLNVHDFRTYFFSEETWPDNAENNGKRRLIGRAVRSKLIRVDRRRFDEILKIVSHEGELFWGNRQIWNYPFTPRNLSLIRGYNCRLMAIETRVNEIVSDQKRRRQWLENTGWCLGIPLPGKNNVVHQPTNKDGQRLVITSTSHFKKLGKGFVDLEATPEWTTDDIRWMYENLEDNSMLIRFQYRDNYDKESMEDYFSRVIRSLEEKKDAL